MKQKTVQNTKKILIIDDNNMNLKIERHLKHFGLDVDTCLSGELAIEKIDSRENYDLILMDNMMLGISGTKTMQKLKLEKNFKKPILVLTTNATEKSKEEYLLAGFDEFVAKHVSREQLYEIVKKYL